MQYNGTHGNTTLAGACRRDSGRLDKRRGNGSVHKDDSNRRNQGAPRAPGGGDGTPETGRLRMADTALTNEERLQLIDDNFEFVERKGKVYHGQQAHQ